MHKTFTVLSLDPMYSLLHERMAELLAKEKYAVTSCMSKWVYLPTFQCSLVSKLVLAQRDATIDPRLRETIRASHSYYHAYVGKKLQRAMSDDELDYMARYYLGLKQFIVERGINLLLIHNDTLWYHAIAILLCKELNIQYLVTELGLIRPYTTVIDNRGVNANGSLFYHPQRDVQIQRRKPKGSAFTKHDGVLSMLYFSVFLLGFFVERLLFNKTIARYLHNDYGLGKYTKKLASKLLRDFRHSALETCQGDALLLLQLENDSQILVHSELANNQRLIADVEAEMNKLGIRLAIKRHPLDETSYQLGEQSYWVDGKLNQLIKPAQFVITVNSSAATSVIETDTPLFLLGESIYAHPGVAKKVTLSQLHAEVNAMSASTDTANRQHFLAFLKHHYLVSGAGFSFDQHVLQERLDVLLHPPVFSQDVSSHDNKALPL
ncbi:phosphoribosylamine--glycine ligase [Vibrio sp. TRT 21S02]|uniref:capsular polysaccharide export protein, LipB/KpsS family n=1 Tax=Vibrio sp. TRT 21S02 TaxID=3418507 RepID=UPI003CF553B0